MGRYKYTESEQEMLKVLKMQAEQLEELDKGIQEDRRDGENDAKELADLRKETEELFRECGITPPPKETTMYVEPKKKISKDEIPSREELVKKANEKHPEEVAFEDLLTKEEFQFCIDDVKRINDEFSQKTGILNKKDMSFLAIATALQTARWLIIQSLCGDLGQTIDGNSRLAHNDKSIKDEVNSSNKWFQKKFNIHDEIGGKYKTCEQILLNGAPYDTIVGSPDFGINLEGGYHRYKTLGHDPVLGWIFGTANFITDTCTLSDFSSYRIARHPTPHFSEPTNLGTIFYEVFDSTKEDWRKLPTGIFAQAVHMKSDVFTKLGLPVPILGTFSESLAGDLYKSQYDLLCSIKDIAIIGQQAYWTNLIDMIVGLVHGIFYNPKTDGDRKLYEVRTRKILCISKALASTGNIIYVTVTKDLKKLDVGSIPVTLYRLLTDINFMTRVKEEYIEHEMNKGTEKEELDSYFE